MNTAHPKTQRQLCFLADVVQERGLNAVSFRFSQQQQEKQNITLMSHFISQLAPDERGSAEQGVAAPPCLLWRGSAFNLFTRLLIFRGSYRLRALTLTRLPSDSPRLPLRVDICMRMQISSFFGLAPKLAAPAAHFLPTVATTIIANASAGRRCDTRRSGEYIVYRQPRGRLRTPPSRSNGFTWRHRVVRLWIGRIEFHMQAGLTSS